LLAVVVAHNEAGVLLLDQPRRREAASYIRDYRRIAANVAKLPDLLRKD
jgi:hypothetical protein